MATEHRDRGFVPVTSNPRLILDRAKDEGKAVECTDATGVTHSFVHTGVMDLWASTRSDTAEFWLHEREIDATLEYRIETCMPDVLLVEESDSTFGGDSDGGQ